MFKMFTFIGSIKNERKLSSAWFGNNGKQIQLYFANMGNNLEHWFLQCFRPIETYHFKMMKGEIFTRFL